MNANPFDPTVHITTTGGTIASRIDPQTGGAVPAVSASELVALAPSIAAWISSFMTTSAPRLRAFSEIGSFRPVHTGDPLSGDAHP